VFVARVSLEEAGRNVNPQHRPILTRAAASVPCSLVDRHSGMTDETRISGMSGISGKVSSMSLDSFRPEYPSYVEFEAFPWNEVKRGLTGLAALAYLLVTATELREFGRRYDRYNAPLHTVVKKTMRKQSSKSGKKTKSTVWISKINGYDKEPPNGVAVEEEDASESQEQY
jgi:hypothetical protein